MHRGPCHGAVPKAVGAAQVERGHPRGPDRYAGVSDAATVDVADDGRAVDVERRGQRVDRRTVDVRPDDVIDRSF